MRLNNYALLRTVKIQLFIGCYGDNIQYSRFLPVMHALSFVPMLSCYTVTPSITWLTMFVVTLSVIQSNIYR